MANRRGPSTGFVVWTQSSFSFSRPPVVKFSKWVTKTGQEYYRGFPQLSFLLVAKLRLGTLPISGAWKGRNSRAEILQGKGNCCLAGPWGFPKGELQVPGMTQTPAIHQPQRLRATCIFHFRRKRRERLPYVGGDGVEKAQMWLEGAQLRKRHTI